MHVADTSLTTLQAISDAVNDAAKGRPLGRLHDLRKRIKGMKRSPSSVVFPTTVRDPQWTWHVGGRDELQFNLGFERANTPTKRVFRYGVAFSFEPSKSMFQPEVDLLPAVQRFNDALPEHQHRLEGALQWSWHKHHRTEPTTPHIIAPKDVRRGTFTVVGWTLDRDPVAADVEVIVDRLEGLLPLYLDTLAPERTWSAQPRAKKTLPPPQPPPAVVATSTTASTTDATYTVNLRQRQIQLALYVSLVAEHGQGAVGWERSTVTGKIMDMTVDAPDGLHIYEVKTAGSARACIREALGQLLEYAHWPGEVAATRLVVVGDAPYTNAAAEYIGVLGKRYRLPIEYREVRSR